jgi:hypothetical protein
MLTSHRMLKQKCGSGGAIRFDIGMIVVDVNMAHTFGNRTLDNGIGWLMSPPPPTSSSSSSLTPSSSPSSSSSSSSSSTTSSGYYVHDNGYDDDDMNECYYELLSPVQQARTIEAIMQEATLLDNKLDQPKRCILQ